MEKLRFSPHAWAKLLYLRDKGNTEVSFLAVTRRPNLDLVVDLVMPKQIGYSAYTEFDEGGLADLFDDMVDRGFHPEEFGRIWCHTHPFASPTPSNTDENTFTREFAAPNWAIMFIIGNTGQCSCRLKYKNHPDLAHVTGSHSSREVTVVVDWKVPFEAGNHEIWDTEYAQKVSVGRYQTTSWNDKATTYQWVSAPSSKDYNNFGHPKGYGLYKQGYKFINDRVGWVPPHEAEKMEEQIKEAQKLLTNNERGTKIGWPRYYGLCVQEGPGETWRKLTKKEEKHTTPKHFYTGPGWTTLTKRELKYFKKHGTMDGFVPPLNDGKKKIETLDFEKDDNTELELLNEKQKEEAQWGVTEEWLKELKAEYETLDKEQVQEEIEEWEAILKGSDDPEEIDICESQLKLLEGRLDVLTDAESMALDNKLKEISQKAGILVDSPLATADDPMGKANDYDFDWPSADGQISTDLTEHADFHGMNWNI